MNCTSVAETAQWGWQRSRARNRACMQSHSRDRLERRRRRRRRRRRESAISRTRSKTGHPDTCCRSIRLMIPYGKLATWQKVGQSARCGPGGDRKRHGTSERGADYGRSFPTSLDPYSILRVCKSIGSKGTGKRKKRERGDDYSRLFNTKGSKTNTEIRRAAARPVIDNVPDRALPSWWDNHFQNCDSRLQIRREMGTAAERCS